MQASTNRIEQTYCSMCFEKGTFTLLAREHYMDLKLTPNLLELCYKASAAVQPSKNTSGGSLQSLFSPAVKLP